jgi:thiamine biosynthesis lipoprotein
MPPERARPLLGTIVTIRASFDGADPDGAIGEAFSEVATVHRLMSFHDPQSDVSRLNRDAACRPVVVDARTFEVLAWSQALAEASDGAFDITSASIAVREGALPAPASPPAPAPGASWRDIELDGRACTARFHRPLWIDLGGVAKGYAVDRAAAALQRRGAQQGVVNAGGDLAVLGGSPEPVLLRTGEAGETPVLELAAGALASSGGETDRQRAPGLHLDARSGAGASSSRFVSVVAGRCMVADSLTKVVMLEGESAAPLLARLGATAYLRDRGQPWRTVGAAA